MPPQETPQPFSSNLVLSTMGWNNFWCRIIISTWYLLQKYLDKNSSCIRSNCMIVAFCLTAYGKPHVISTAQQNGINFFSSIKTNTKLLAVGAHTSWQSLGNNTHVHLITHPHMWCAFRIMFLQVLVMCVCVTYFLTCKVQSQFQKILQWIYSQVGIGITILLCNLSAINCQNVPFFNASTRSGNPR